MQDYQFKAEVLRAVSLMRDEMEKDPGDVMPRIMCFKRDGSLQYYAIDPAVMGNWPNKNLVGAAIVKCCFEENTLCAVFLSDTLYGSPPKGKTFEDMPRNLDEWPAGTTAEAVLITVNARGAAGFQLGLRYSRDRRNRRVFGELDDIAPQSKGRFVFDLTECSEAGAVADALLRGRSGLVEKVS